jgi:type IV pilus assembly protein PilE
MAATPIASLHRGVVRGFSILELVVVVAVMAVLLTLAVPSYRQYMVRAERADAIRFLLAVANCQERIRAGIGVYDTTRCLENTSIDGYQFRMEPADNMSTSRFLVLAEPEQSEGNLCGVLGLDHTGTRSISEESGAVSDCWGGR